jgi:hypothetical protein
VGRGFINWLLSFFFTFFSLTKKSNKKSQGRTPYFIFIRTKSQPTICNKNKISLRSSTPTALLPTYALVNNNSIPVKNDEELIKKRAIALFFIGFLG